MRLAWLVTASILLIEASIAHGETLSDCSAMKVDAERLACFDRMSKPANQATKDPKSEVGPEASSEPPKKVGNLDLAVAPGKYMNRFIEVSGAHCFYADQNSYRCLASQSAYGTVLVIQSVDITPLAEKKKIEDDCDTIVNMPTLKCARTLRFIPESSDDDTVNQQDRVTVTTFSMEAVPVAQNTRKRSRR